MAYFIVGLIGGTISAAIAPTKNRNPLGWFVIGFLLPLIGLILILVLPDGEDGLVDPSLDHYNAMPPNSPVPSSPVVEIEKLSALHAQGALTDAEFTTKKAVLLDRIV